MPAPIIGISAIPGENGGFLALFRTSFMSLLLSFSCPSYPVLSLSWTDSRDPDPFEWYQDYANLKHILLPYTTKAAHILVVGCGNSGQASTRCPLCQVDLCYAVILMPHSCLVLPFLLCNNVELSAEIFNNKPTTIVNIDFSNVVIEQMKKVYAELKPLKCRFILAALRLFFSCLLVRSLCG